MTGKECGAEMQQDAAVQCDALSSRGFLLFVWFSE